MPNPSFDIELHQRGLFALQTTRFGLVTEMMLRLLYGMEGSGQKAFDLKTPAGARIESKFGRVTRAHSSSITRENLLDNLRSALVPRALSLLDGPLPTFSCTISQVKPHLFDYLYYGLFFWDVILIFRMQPENLTEIAYTPIQHRGNVGEGNFFINNRTLPQHLTRFYWGALDYPQFFDLFRGEPVRPLSPALLAHLRDLSPLVSPTGQHDAAPILQRVAPHRTLQLF